MKVLPEPVAIWMRARGRFSFSDFSRLWIAVICAGQRPSSLSGGMDCMRARKVAAAVHASLRVPLLSGCAAGAVVQPFGQVSGLWKANTGARPGVGIESVGEAGFDAGGLVGKRQRVAPARQAVGQALGVFVRLGLDAGEGDAFLLGLDHPGGLAVHIEQVVGEAVAGQRESRGSPHHARRGCWRRRRRTRASRPPPAAHRCFPWLVVPAVEPSSPWLWSDESSHNRES